VSNFPILFLMESALNLPSDTRHYYSVCLFHYLESLISYLSDLVAKYEKLCLSFMFKNWKPHNLPNSTKIYDQCVCDSQGTVTDVLVDCPGLKKMQRELWREVGDAFRSLLSLLEGSSEGKRGKPDTVSRSTPSYILPFRSRAPRGQPSRLPPPL
jgi:hypothetical protein